MTNGLTVKDVLTPILSKIFAYGPSRETKRKGGKKRKRTAKGKAAKRA